MYSRGGRTGFNHITSWLGLCPNNRITGGKVKSSQTRLVVNRAANAFRMAAQTATWEQFRKEYETSDDRSCALLCTSYLDHCLKILILESLTHKEDAYKSLFSEMMPLGTFSTKV